MPEPDRRGERFLLMLILCPAVAAFGAAYDQPFAWAFALPCVVSVFWQIRRVPGWLRTGTQVIAHLFELLAVGLGFIFMAYPVLSPHVATRLSLIAGYGLCAFASLFLLGTEAWPMPSALWPATVGLMVVACFNPDAKIRPLLVGPGLAAMAYMALPSLGRELRKVSAARWAKLLVFTLVTALIAAVLLIAAPLMQSQTEKMWFQFAESHVLAYSGLSATTRLGDLEELKLSHTVVMRVWTNRPQDLRARAYLRFDGRGWVSPPSRGPKLENISAQANSYSQWHDWLQSVPGATFVVSAAELHEVSADPPVHTRIVQKLFNNGMMVSPGGTFLVRADLPNLRQDAQQNLLPPATGGAEIYGILSRNDGNIVRRAAATAAEVAEALQVPVDTDPRIRELASRLAAGANSPEEKLSRTIAYLQRDYQYTLKVGAFHSAQPVAEFLFEKKAGYCQYFASAAALLLRIEGVPARYVTGFHLEEDNRVGDHYVVRELDAHAWIEAYIPGTGWVQADPTPAAEYASLHAGVGHGWFNNTVEWMQAKFAEVMIRVTSSNWRSTVAWLWGGISAAAHWLLFTRKGLGLCALSLSVWIGRQVYKRRKAATKTGSLKKKESQYAEAAPELALLLKRLDSYWSDCGVARPASRAPLEHLDSIPVGKLPTQMQRLSREVIESYYCASFGGVAPAAHEIEKLQSDFEQASARTSTLG
jgi:hypothetical protein